MYPWTIHIMSSLLSLSTGTTTTTTVSPSSSSGRRSLNVLLIIVLLMLGGTSPQSSITSTSSSSVVMALSLSTTTTTTTTTPTSSSTTASLECAVIGVGVLGTSLCKQLLESPKFKEWKVIGITKSTTRHDAIMKDVGGDHHHSGRFSLTTADALKSEQPPGRKFSNCVFCAPPSGFDDYASAIEDSIFNIWSGPSGGGMFVFTSSGGIYGPGESTAPPMVVTEDSELPDATGNPRSERLMAGERVVLSHGGVCLRLAGLYTLDRGAHNFWLGKDTVAGRSDGIVNLLHYDDAAGSVLAALSVSDPSTLSGKIFLISDGHPMTRQQICDSSLKATRYDGMTVPAFSGPVDGPIGKIYDGRASNEALQWKPRYPSFDEFMASQ